MNQWFHKKIVMLFANACLVGLSGCGAQVQGVLLKPTLPDSLRGQAKWTRLKGTASHWELVVKPKPDGTDAHWTFAPAATQFPVVRLPEAAGGRWELTLRLWDRGPNGAVRSFPILSGKRVVTRGEVHTPSTVELPLTLRSGVELP